MQGREDFTGRAAEREQVAALLGALAGGRGRLVLVEGEAGIGKTRLCEHVLDSAREVAATASVTCWESDAVPAFWPWERLLSATGVPLPAPATGDADPQAARVRLFDAVTDALAARAAGTPLVLVVDDAQWADELSRAYLRFLAPALRDLPVLVVAAVRTGEDAGDDLVARTARNAARLRLRGLAPEELKALVPGVADVDALHRRTAGNPLFARELAALGEGGPLPDTVRAVLRRRVDRLGDSDLLAVAAVSGDRTGYDVLRATVGDGFLGPLDDAARAGVLVCDETSAAFAHPLLRDVVLDGLGVAQRVRLHQRVAAALESLPGAPLAALAAHYAAAAAAGSAERAVRYGVAAGDEAQAMLAYEQAAAHYDRALRSLDLAPGAADRADLHLRRGTALTAAGRPREARAAFTAAAGEARRAGGVEAFARAALAVGSGEGFEVTLFDAEQQALLTEAIGLVTDHALKARLVARLSVARSLAEPAERRRAAAEEALALARESGDAEATCDALAALCDAIAGPSDAERRVALAGELVAAAGGDVRRELLGRRLLVVAHLERGDLSSADAEIERYAAGAARLRSPLYSWYVPLWRAMRATMRGDAEAAERLLDQAGSIGREAGSDNAYLLVVTARCIGTADAGLADESFLAALPSEPMPGLWLSITTALAYAALCRHDEARALLDHAVSRLDELPYDSEYLPALVQAALTAWRLGGHPGAETLYAALLPHRHRFAVEGIGAYCHGSVERHLAMLATLLGRTADARAHRDAAREANRGNALLLALVGDEPRSTTGHEGELRRDGDVWVVGLGGRSVHVRDSKGVRDLAVLLARPGEAVAAMDLYGGVSGNDLGDVVDATARAAYKQRLADLDGEIEDADATADLARGERARGERDALVAALAAAYGLGGRARKAGDPAERARSAVTARLRDALRRIEAADAETGAHLRRSVRTGTFCVYDPVTPVRWRLTP